MTYCLSPRKRGFTLVEMIVVFSVLAVIAVIAAKTYSTVYNRGKLARVEAGIGEIDAALQRFKMANGGYYPGLSPWPITSTGGSVAAYPRDQYFAGPRVIGGSAGFADDPTAVAQDDYLYDKKTPQSPFVNAAFTASYPLYLSNITRPNSPMKPVDSLVAGGFFNENKYPNNPYRPGSSMVNVAFMLGSYRKSTNAFSLVALPNVSGYNPRGLTIGRPEADPVSGQLNSFYRYSLQATHWSLTSLPPGVRVEDVYPEGDFAYIPLGRKDPKAQLVPDYWLIGYGSIETRSGSPYNEWLQENPTLPDFPPPMGDGNPNSLTGFERTVRSLLYGALTVRGSKYVDQLNSVRQ